MIIDTKKTVIRVQLRRFLQLLVFCVVLLVLLFALKKPPYEYWGLTRYHWAMILVGVYGLSLLIENLLELNYIYFSDQEDRLVFRYFSMSMMNNKKHSVEIPKDKFRGYTILNDFYGLRKRIVLKQVLTKSEATYPPVSLSALSRKEFEDLIKAFERYVK